MKLAEALTKVKYLKGKVAGLQLQLQSDALFEVVDTSSPILILTETITELTQVLENLRQLKTRIDTANVKHGLADKIHEMEQLRYAVKVLDELTKHKQEVKKIDRYSQTQSVILTVATYNVSELTGQVDTMRDRIRQLDLELQKTNWQVDV